MAKLLFPLGLITVFISTLLCTVSAVRLDELFVIQKGNDHGGCGAYYNFDDGTGILDDWLDEIIGALANAIDAIDKYEEDVKVRAALKTWFGVTSKNQKPATGTQKVINAIGDNLKVVQDFFEAGPPGNPKYPLDNNRYLFCDSNWLVQQTDDEQARDWQNKGIEDQDNDVVPISAVPIYQAALKEEPGNKIWWSGQYSTVNGYYFSPTGGSYCGTNQEHLGLTSDITELEVDSSGNPTKRQAIESVVICPGVFTNSHPASYKDGDALIKEKTNLADVVPRSATLMHEAFHVAFGAGDTGFLQGNEIYDMISCIDKAAKDPTKTARKNPENYVFFVSHLFYLYGSSEEYGITKNWDFKTQTNSDGNKIFGAVAVS